MFEIRTIDAGNLAFTGRLTAAYVDQVRATLNELGASCRIDLSELTYVSSAGLGVLLGAQKRLQSDGHQLTLVQPTPHLRDVFQLVGFDQIFQIE